MTSSFPSDYRQWLAKLISFDTTSRNSNLDFIAYVESYLQSLGIATTRVYNEEKTKANLWATLPGENGAMQGGIILSGHTDVVPVDGQKWDTDPFQMVEKDGKLYGRGTCDMKGFLAVVLTQTPTFLAMKRVKPVHYAFSYDEEVGCLGAGVLVEHLKAQGFTADCCLVGEPRGHFIGTGNKGHFFWRIVVHGKAIHSSMALMNTSCNAIEYGALIITKIRQIAEHVRATDKRDTNYTCPFSPLSVNLVQGGNAVNTVPAECTIEFSVRLMNMDVGRQIEAEIKAYIDSTILPSMRAEYAEASVDYTVDTSLPPFNADEQNAFTQLARKVMGNTLMHKSGGGTEAGHFQQGLGIPTVINGPAGGGAHEPNEYVEVKNMELSVQFATKLVAACTSGNSFVTSAASL